MAGSRFEQRSRGQLEVLSSTAIDVVGGVKRKLLVHSKFQSSKIVSDLLASEILMDLGQVLPFNDWCCL